MVGKRAILVATSSNRMDDDGTADNLILVPQILAGAPALPKSIRLHLKRLVHPMPSCFMRRVMGLGQSNPINTLPCAIP